MRNRVRFIAALLLIAPLLSAVPARAAITGYDPLNVFAQDDAGQMVVTWEAPEVGDYTQYLTGYEVSWVDDSAPSDFRTGCSTNTSTFICEIPLPGDATYSAVVSGVFVVPDGTEVLSASNSNSVFIARAEKSIPYPPVPTNVTAVPANGFATVSWKIPADFNTKFIDGYTATASPGGLTCSTTTELSCAIDGLSNGVAYTFTVVATNLMGDSDSSVASEAVTPSYVPAAPTNVVATRGNKQLTVAWTAPTDTGGYPILSYTATIAPGGQTCKVVPPVTSCVFTGLTNGTPYSFTVTAENLIGDSVASEPSSSLAPATFPNPPTGLLVIKGNKQVAIQWTAPVDNGGANITRYTATSNPGGLTCVTTTKTCTVTGLTNGTSYTFTVVATNVVGDSISSASSSAATPVGPPTAPTDVTAQVADASAPVSWTAPTDTGGTAITGYTARANPSGKQCTSVTTSCTITGLTNGTSYTFTVVATNAQGDSPASVASAAVTPAKVPTAPTGVTATAGVGTTANISWTTPSSDGGSAITGYTVTSSPVGLTCSTAANSCSVSGLTYGVSYRFTVVAINGIGSSPSSALSAIVKITTKPGAPTDVVAVKGNKAAAVSWKAPVFTGGAEITQYTVTSSPGNFTCFTSDLTCAVAGLTNGTNYTFTVIASNAVGDSPASVVSNSVSPVAVPNAPTDVNATLNGTGAEVTWLPPADAGGLTITSYTVTASPSGKTCTTSLLVCRFSGLVIGTSYTFTVIATSGLGDSIPSFPSQVITPVTLPAAPTNVSGTPADASVLVRWQAPTDNGGSPITQYIVVSSPGGRTCKTSSTECVITGLLNGTSYTFTVVASNIAGESPKSDASSPVLPRSKPGAPTGVEGLAGDGSVFVSWVAPTNTGGLPIDSYIVTSSPGGFTCTTTTRSCTVRGLTNKTGYRFTVVAVNAAGSSTSSASSLTVTPDVGQAVKNPPTAPESITATAFDAEALVQWTASSNLDGLPLKGYTVTSTPGNLVCVTSGLSCSFTGLTNGVAYTFHVIAATAAGDSPASEETKPVTPKGYPLAPSFITAIAGARSAVVSWSIPEETGGLPITQYEVIAAPDGARCVTDELTCVVEGLVNGVTYTFTVTAVNRVGPSFESVASNAVIPLSAPVAPVVSVLPIISPGSALVRWEASTDNGGSALYGYTVVSSPDGRTCMSKSTFCTVTGLRNGVTYTFTVHASNSIGDSPESNPSAAVTPLSIPTAPLTVTVVGDAKTLTATISWLVPASDGGLAIKKYLVTSTPGSLVCQTVGLSCAITGLRAGVSYTFTVVATNNRGDSPASVASAPLMLAGLAAAPSGIKIASTKANTAQISFTAAALNGGTLIRYEYRTSTNNGKNFGSWVKVGTVTKATTTGWKKGVTYLVQVRAVTNIGLGTPGKATFKPTK